MSTRYQLIEEYLLGLEYHVGKQLPADRANADKLGVVCGSPLPSLRISYDTLQPEVGALCSNDKSMDFFWLTILFTLYIIYLIKTFKRIMKKW